MFLGFVCNNFLIGYSHERAKRVEWLWKLDKLRTFFKENPEIEF